MIAIVSCLKEWHAELHLVLKSFMILIDHRNLNLFTKNRLLNGKQVRNNDIMQGFDFYMKLRPESTCERPDDIFCREQDEIGGINDERIDGRIPNSPPSISAN